jgi:hypothetical protein
MSQIFCQPVDINILFELLDKICLKKDKYYVVDNNAFRKLIFHNYHIEFMDKIVDFYHLSKQFYVTRKINYKSFTNIVRQICKLNNIMFTSEIKYSESNYAIDYYVFFSE